MALPLVGALIDAGMKVLDRVLPDPAAKQAAQLELLKLQQAGEFKALEADLQLAVAQTEVNKIEAASASLFVSGWRPYVGWVCGTGLAFQFLLAPIATWIAGLAGHPLAFPPLDMGTLMTLLAGLLGLGGMRTAEKMRGVAAR